MLERAPSTDPAPGLELQLLAERVGHSTLGTRVFDPTTRAILTKAVDFFDRALRGEEAARTYSLRVTSSEDLPAFEVGMKAYRILSAREVLTDVASTFSRLREVCQRIALGNAEDAPIDELELLRGFFSAVREATRPSEERNTDRVVILSQ